MQHEECGKGLGRKGQEEKHKGIKKVTRLAQNCATKDLEFLAYTE